MEPRHDVPDNETTLLWGWDNRLCRYMRRSDLVPMARAIRTRLLGRASIDPQLADLYESAASGWKLIADRLAERHREAA